MPDKKNIRRIQEALDKILSSEEREALNRSLSGDDEARSLHRDLEQVVSVLGSVPDMDVPAGLEQRILNSLHPKQYRPNAVSRKTKAPVFRVRRPWAVGFAAGAVLTAVLMVVFRINGISIHGLGMRSLSGSVGVGEDFPYRTIRTVAFDPEGCDGAFLLRQWKDRVSIRIDFRVPSESEMALRFRPGDLRFEGVRPEDGASFRFESHQDRIQTSLTGTSPLTLLFRTLRKEPVSLDLSLVRSGKIVWSNTFSIRAEE
jgi:hypothetical protein